MKLLKKSEWFVISQMLSNLSANKLENSDANSGLCIDVDFNM